MNNEEFSANLDAVHTKVDSVLRDKSEEYAADNDCLHNFKVAAGMQGITVKEALGGMMAKHTTSIYDMIADGKSHSLEKWDEKIIAHINYLILLRAILVEEGHKEPALSRKIAEVVRDIQTDPQQYLKPADSFKSNVTFGKGELDD